MAACRLLAHTLQERLPVDADAPAPTAAVSSPAEPLSASLHLHLPRAHLPVPAPAMTNSLCCNISSACRRLGTCPSPTQLQNLHLHT